MSIHIYIYIYIGETKKLSQRLKQHNSGHGASGTTPSAYRPFCLFAYICGFDCNHQLMLHIEHQWKVYRDRLIESGNQCPKAIARCANDMLANLTHERDETLSSKLRLICNFSD